MYLMCHVVLLLLVTRSCRNVECIGHMIVLREKRRVRKTEKEASVQYVVVCREVCLYCTVHACTCTSKQMVDSVHTYNLAILPSHDLGMTTIGWVIAAISMCKKVLLLDKMSVMLAFFFATWRQSRSFKAMYACSMP
jgi:hypothetical protein